METRRKRLTLDLNPTFQRRQKAIAALKGVSMCGYSQAPIDRELTKDEANGLGGLLSDKPDHGCLQSSGKRYSAASLFLGIPPLGPGGL